MSADATAPAPSSYRLSPEKIQEDLCQGRRLSPDTQDKRWKPAVYSEVQCTGKPVSDSDLCLICTKRQERYAEDESPKANWHGRISDEPFGWAHMLGTTWADEKKPKWMGEITENSDAASETSDAAAGAGSVKANKAAEKAAKDAEKAAAKAAKEAEKEAAKAAKEAEKAAAAVPVAAPAAAEATVSRIAALEAENAALKETVAAFRAVLRAIA